MWSNAEHVSISTGGENAFAKGHPVTPERRSALERRWHEIATSLDAIAAASFIPDAAFPSDDEAALLAEQDEIEWMLGSDGDHTSR